MGWSHYTVATVEYGRGVVIVHAWLNMIKRLKSCEKKIGKNHGWGMINEHCSTNIEYDRV